MGYPTHIDCEKHGPEQQIVCYYVLEQGRRDYICRRCHEEAWQNAYRLSTETSGGPIAFSREPCYCTERIKRLEDERDGYLRALILAVWEQYSKDGHGLYDWEISGITYGYLREAVGPEIAAKIAGSWED